MFKPLLRSALLLSSLTLLPHPASAQNLPGTELDTSAVSTQIQNLFSLAEQAYPSMFGGASGWRVYQGYTFKYFSVAGIYAGIKDGQVYLMGGPYGNNPVPQGDITAIISALQTRIANLPNPNPGAGTADFGNLLIAKTLNDLTNIFRSVTMEYGTQIGTLSLITQIKLDVLGQEDVGGIATTHMKATITASGAGQTYDMWVDSSGTFRRLALGSFEYPAATAQAVGPGIVSGFLIALSALDNAQVKSAIAGEIQNPALSTKVSKRIVGDIEADTFMIEVSTGSDASIKAYISDFGNFTMMTEFSSTLFTQSTFIEIIDMDLK